MSGTQAGTQRKPVFRVLIIVLIYFCAECNCHGKSEECYYNQTVADMKLSLNIHGEYKGGGVCHGCSDNTAGVNCQSCIDGFYRPSEVRLLVPVHAVKNLLRMYYLLVISCDLI